MTWSKKIDSWRSRLQAGNVISVSSELEAENFKSLPSSHVSVVAQFCRRCQLTELALQLLAPLLEKGTHSPTGDEIIEYALCLMHSDLQREAEDRLREVDSTHHPQVLLYRASSHFREWDYEAAIPLLEQYKKLVSDPYQQHVAETNLIMAEIGLLHTKGIDERLKALLQKSSDEGWNRIIANGHDLFAQWHLLQENWTEALNHLQLLENSASLDGTLDLLFCKKLKSMAESHLQNSPEPLLLFKEKALLQSHWETVRFVDYELLRFQPELVDRLYYGTPYPKFRKKITDRYEVPSSGYWTNGVQSLGYDLQSGELNGKEIATPGKTVHRVLTAMTQDLYRPVTTGSLFSAIFPGENYDPDTSINRVYQAVHRTKKWFRKYELPLEIDAKNKVYRLLYTGEISFFKTAEAPVDRESWHLKRLKEEFQQQTFTSRQASDLLGLGVSQTTRLLKRKIESGEILRNGSGNNTVYLIAKN